MNFFPIQPIKLLRQAWRALCLRSGERLTSPAVKKAKQIQANKPNHRHRAFIELP